ncbi:MAG: hypothetical protein ACRDTC_23965 [Pseudonocardiaceae bacterium]
MTTPQDPHGEPPPAFPPPSPSSIPPPAGDGTAPAPREVKPTRPKEVTISFWLWAGNALIGLVVIVVVISQYDTIRDVVLDGAREAAQRQGGIVDERQLDVITTAVIVVFAVVFLAVSTAQLLFAVFMRNGRNWARIVLTVLGGLLLLVQLLSLTGTAGGELALTALSTAVLVAAIITMYLPAANPWFHPHPQSPQP